MGKKYSVGLDFGTESGRAVLVDVSNGQIMATSVNTYTNGVIDERLPGSDLLLEPNWALQDPNDYLNTIKVTVPEIIKETDVDPTDVIGIGIDFTACTMMPTTSDGTPFAFLPEWNKNPHAWVKLWKHHAAQPEADRINETARKMGGLFLPRYGGKISSEWFFSKALQILDEAPEIYQAAGRLIEASDWVVWMLTGEEKRCACTAGYKALWEKSSGFPEKAFFRALDPRMENIVDEKMSPKLYPLGARAGGLTREAAAWTGLIPGTPVAIANMDAHVAVPACTVTEPGRMVMIMGTSICHMVLGNEQKIVEGMCGVVEDGFIPQSFGYEAGQSCFGDHFAWFTEHCTPASYEQEAGSLGLSIHEYLEKKAEKLKPGESGLVALDWWNGNRSILVDADLTGVLLGATLATKPEEIYRALLEATAFGTRIIIEAFEKSGVSINELVACGGLPERNKLLMQIFADITGREIRVSASAQTSALGAAMYGTVAAGAECGGYDTIFAAAVKMAHLSEVVYRPNEANSSVYDQLYAEYVTLYDYFGRGTNDIMKRLLALKAKVLNS
jgi:L-ribulokinase